MTETPIVEKVEEIMSLEVYGQVSDHDSIDTVVVSPLNLILRLRT